MKRSGYTLIELLVALAIMAALMAVLLPTLIKIRIQTKKAVCITNLHQVGIAIQAWRNDHPDPFPPSLEDCRPYAKNKDIFQCAFSNLPYQYPLEVLSQEWIDEHDKSGIITPEERQSLTQFREWLREGTTQTLVEQNAAVFCMEPRQAVLGPNLEYQYPNGQPILVQYVEGARYGLKVPGLFIASGRVTITPRFNPLTDAIEQWQKDHRVRE